VNFAALFEPVAADLKVPSAVDEIKCETCEDAEIFAEAELLRARVQAARSWGS
jgi:hypothetical protein